MSGKKGEIERERDHLYGAREAYSLERWTENTYGCRTELNSISCNILKAAANKSEKKKLQNIVYVIEKISNDTIDNII